jgi:hypothetical protein
MFICCECCVLSGRGLCAGLITRPEESYRLWRVVVCDQQTSKTRRLKPATGLWKIQPQWVVNDKKTLWIIHPIIIIIIISLELPYPLIYSMINVRVKQSLYRLGQALRAPGGWSPQISGQKSYECGDVSPTHRPPLTPRNYSWYSCLLGAESNPGPYCGRKVLCQLFANEPATSRLVAQCLNQLRHRVPPAVYVTRFNSRSSCSHIQYKTPSRNCRGEFIGFCAIKVTETYYWHIVPTRCGRKVMRLIFF